MIFWQGSFLRNCLLVVMRSAKIVHVHVYVNTCTYVLLSCAKPALFSCAKPALWEHTSFAFLILSLLIIIGDKDVCY